MKCMMNDSEEPRKIIIEKTIQQKEAENLKDTRNYISFFFVDRKKNTLFAHLSCKSKREDMILK